MNNQQPKSPREWEIAKIFTESGEHVSIVGPATATTFSDENYWQKVIEHSHHVAEVARLEAEIAGIKAEFPNNALQNAWNRDAAKLARWKSCAVKLAEGLRQMLIHGWDEKQVGLEALKHFDGLQP